MFARRPLASAVALYSLVALAAAAAAYFAIFTQFGSGDDEGTLLVSLKAFSHGQTLYRDVYSPYGPFYYELFGGFFALTGLAVTNDASRLIVIAVWVGASVLYGVSAQRLSGRLLLGVAAMIVAFAVLGVLINEPMHPHGLCVLLLAALTLLVSGPPRRFGLAGAGTGALLAALILTKVNVGGLAIAAIALAAVLTIEPLYRRRWLRWPVIAAFLLLPTALMVRELRAEWIRDLIALELFATVALLVAARLQRPRRGESDGGLFDWALGAVVGFGAAFVAIFIALLLSGSSAADLYDGAIAQGLKIGDVFVLPLVSPVAALEWAVAAVAAAVLTVELRSDSRRSRSIWPGLLRVAAGLTIWFTIARSAPFSLGPTSNQEALPLVLAWVAVVSPAGAEEPPYRRFMRVALASLPLAEVLQVYPVAGSQIGIAAISFVAVGAICLTDGIGLLRAWSEDRGAQASRRFAVVTVVLLAALAGKLGLDVIVRPAATNAVIYSDQTALPFSGAGLLHLPADQAGEYAQLVSLLHAHRCSTFIGYPNVNGLYLWSGIDPPKPNAPGAWVAVLDSDGQQQAVDEMRASPRPCAIRKDPLADAWLQGRPPPDTPLVHYIFDDFEQVASVNEWQFLLPKGSG